ncbi:MAG: ADOP family duplicated permease, partial [Gemmatimonas sp.]
AIKPVIGRFFTAAEDVPPDGSRVIVLTYGLWQTQFGGRMDVLGSTIDVGASKYTIIGVTPEGFNGFGADPIVAFIPVSAASANTGSPTMPWYNTYNIIWLQTFARRKPGVTAAAASADLANAYQRSYKKELEVNPTTTAFNIAKPRAFAGPVLLDRGPNEGSEAKVATWLVGVAVIVLLIACANVANLLLARALRRRREIAVRIALGVSRSRLMMQLATESLLLALLGGLAGLGITQWGGTIMRTTLLDQSAAGPSAFSDPRILGLSALLAVVAGLLTGLAPLFQTGREDVSSALKAGAREGHVHRSRLRSALLVGQAALSVVLLVGAGLFIRSLANVQNVRMGYDAERLLWVQPRMRGVKTDSVQSTQMLRGMLEHAQAIPGVERATRALTVPFWTTWSQRLFVAGIDSVSKLGDFTLQAATPSFFSTMGTRILRGRAFTAADGEHAPRVMVIGESMAKRIWPSEDAIGKCIRVRADTMPCTTVVGIAEDVRRGKISETEMHYYMPTDQFQPQSGGLFVRTSGPATGKADQVRREMQKLMPGVSYVTVTPMSTIIAPEIRAWKIGAIMFAVFGALALVLAAIGLYSVIAYNVTQRTHEMGVRVALGAQARDVVQLIVRDGLRVVIPGVILGAIIALVAGKWVAPLLFQVSPKDPPVFAGVVVMLIAVAIAASWIPATRAARVDPNKALRSD